jgi:hypothetical protein
MILKKPFSYLAALAICAAAFATSANAATINSDIPVAGTFNASLGGSGSANLTGASGTFRQWISGPFGTGFHANINVSANPQSVGLSIPSVNPGNMAASGNVDLDYDNVTPGTPQVVNAVNLDLNGNTNIGFVINAAPLSINTSLGSFNLVLTVNGQITDIDFNSTGSSAVSGGNGGVFANPGNFSVTLNGNVSGVLTGVPIVGNINLGNLFTIAPTTLPFAAALPGFATLSDLQGGLPPFPNDMLANFQAMLPSIPVPLNLPIAVNQSASIPNGQSGFSSLVINGNIAATLTLGNPSYNVSGTVDQVLVPEPSTLAMSSLAMLGLTVLGLRRRNRS